LTPSFTTRRGTVARKSSGAEDVLERDYFMTAEMAKDFGLVDKVIDKRPEMPPPSREG
jgi:ATP-dependent protease ClpP protease subunit